VEVGEPLAPLEEAAPVAVEKAVDRSSVPFPQNRKKTIVFVCLVLCVVGLAIGLGVGLSNKNKSAENADNNAASTTDLDSALQEPSAEVQTVCNGDYNADLTCEDVCQPAACCPKYLEEDSCYDGNEDICDMWLTAGCFNLGINEQDPEEDAGDGELVGGDSGATLDEPTVEVETVCKGEYNASLTCEDVCEPAACCPEYLGEDSCYEGNEEVCDRWLDAGCFNFAVDFEEP
jgi:hypothetical protein